MLLGVHGGHGGDAGVSERAESGEGGVGERGGGEAQVPLDRVRARLQRREELAVGGLEPARADEAVSADDQEGKREGDGEGGHGGVGGGGLGAQARVSKGYEQGPQARVNKGHTHA